MIKFKVNNQSNNLVSLKQREKVLFDNYKQNRTYKEKRIHLEEMFEVFKQIEKTRN